MHNPNITQNTVHTVLLFNNILSWFYAIISTTATVFFFINILIWLPLFIDWNKQQQKCKIVWDFDNTQVQPYSAFFFFTSTSSLVLPKMFERR